MSAFLVLGIGLGALWALKRSGSLEVGVPYRIAASYPLELDDDDLTELVLVLEDAGASEIMVDMDRPLVTYVIRPTGSGWNGVPQGLPLTVESTERLA